MAMMKRVLQVEAWACLDEMKMMTKGLMMMQHDLVKAAWFAKVWTMMNAVRQSSEWNSTLLVRMVATLTQTTMQMMLQLITTGNVEEEVEAKELTLLLQMVAMTKPKLTATQTQV
jgi:hypothetical protein